MIERTSPYQKNYRPDRRLRLAYEEAIELDEGGLKALCPSYSELVEESQRYQDGELLGKGSLKEVYRTYDRRTSRWVAMARLRPERGSEYFDVLVNEAWLTASLSHPNIIKVHDTGVDRNGRPFFTMDLKGNRSLADLVLNSERLGQRNLLLIFSKICDAMAYAHSKGVIHLDLKPENIQADQFGEVLVCDWGLGKLIGSDEEKALGQLEFVSRDNMTLFGQVKGSPGYMAPEQVIASGEKDERTDIFSLGCLLHFILTGEPPFGGTPEEVLKKTELAEFESPRLRFPERKIPESLNAVVVKALARGPGERYGTALELQHDIQNFLTGYATAAEHPGFFREARLFIWRNRLPVLIFFSALAVVAALALLFAHSLERKNQLAVRHGLRAEQLASEAETFSGLYENVLAQTNAEREALAKTIMASSNRIKNIGIFTQPGYTVTECQKLVDAAFELEPDSLQARTQQVSLNCIRLNFRPVVQEPSRFGSNHPDFMAYAQAFPDFAFGREDRPTIEQLTHFFTRAREISDEQPYLIERAAGYDFEHRTDKSEYIKVLPAFIGYYNGGPEEVRLSHNEESSSLTVTSDREICLLLAPLGGSGESFLRFIFFRNLRLELSELFSLSQLNALPIETLDLRACQKVDLGERLELPNLREVIIQPDQLESEILRAAISSAEPFVVREKPEN